jgi:hypothetical protein
MLKMAKALIDSEGHLPAIAGTSHKAIEAEAPKPVKAKAKGTKAKRRRVRKPA